MPSDTESCDAYVDTQDFEISNETNSFDSLHCDSRSSSCTNSTDLELHRAIFERRPVTEIHKILSEKSLKYDKTTEVFLSQKDFHGNTPLHLAVMRGVKETIHLLLTHKAPIKRRNASGWTPLDEAISYGDRQIIKLLLVHARKQTKKHLNTRRPQLIKALTLIPDFVMTLKWEFHSWVPIVKRFLPSDTCKIYKKGSCIRLDSTLIDFSERNWQRGNITFLFDGQKKPSKSLTLCDNDSKVYQIVSYKNPSDIEEDLDLLMSSDIVQPYMSTKSIAFTRVQAGWFFYKQNKTELVGDYNADFYHINGLSMISKKRREHLTEEDIKSNKAILTMVKNSLNSRKNGQSTPQLGEKPTDVGPKSSVGVNHGSVDDESCDSSEEDGETFHDVQQFADDYMQVKRRQSLPPPEVSDVSWEEYINAPKGSPPCISRPWRVKEDTKNFKAVLAMSQDFPLSLESLLNILEVVTPFKHFDKLRQFIRLKLPPGFPVKIELPIVPTIMGTVTFLDFNYNENLSDELFEVQSDYVLDSERFGDVS